MDHLSLQILKLLRYFELLSLNSLLKAAQIALLILEELEDFLRKELGILHQVPKMLGMHRNVGAVPLRVYVG